MMDEATREGGIYIYLCPQGGGRYAITMEC